MSDAALDLGDLAGVESPLAGLRQSRSGDAADIGPGLARQDLDAEPQLESVLVRPDRPNRRRRVSLDQENRRLPVVNGGRGRLYGRTAGADLVGVNFMGPRCSGNVPRSRLPRPSPR